MRHGFPSLSNVRSFEDYVLSFDTRTRVPSWVFEHLTEQSVAKNDDVDRQKCQFTEDKSFHEYFRWAILLKKVYYWKKKIFFWWRIDIEYFRWAIEKKFIIITSFISLKHFKNILIFMGANSFKLISFLLNIFETY